MIKGKYRLMRNYNLLPKLKGPSSDRIKTVGLLNRGHLKDYELWVNPHDPSAFVLFN